MRQYYHRAGRPQEGGGNRRQCIMPTSARRARRPTIGAFSGWRFSNSPATQLCGFKAFQ
jgi:hypothetical protein